MIRSLHLLALPALLLALLLMSACQVDPEKSPAFAQSQEKLKKLEEEQKKTQRSAESIVLDLDVINNDIKTLKANAKAAPQGTSPDTAALLERINKLEQEVKALSDAAESRKKPGADVSPTTKPETKPETPAKPSSATKTATAKTAKPGKTAVAEGKSDAPKSKGFYYQVKQGDTVQSVAQANGISSADLCKANHLPADAPLYPVQQIYIPGK